jgi:Oxidoreductase family, NAD-binding Rossmann fold
MDAQVNYHHSSSGSTPKVRVGLIGCGQVAQVVHIPTLGFLSDYFRITYLCDVSTGALEHCQAKIPGSRVPKITKNATELCSSDDVDVVFVLSSDEYHAEQAILALQHDKYVFVEKPAALNLRDIDRIQQAEKSSKGKLMVGYMRRYASAFETAIKEIGGIDKILYARVRDIIGANSTFVDQSGMFPKIFNDLEERDVSDRKDRATELVHHALEVECNVPASASAITMWRVLGGLGTHDISAMREALGMPLGVVGVHTGFPFWKYV